VLVNAGAKADALSLTPMGATAVVWRRGSLPPLEVAAGETLGVDAAGQEVAVKGAKAKPQLGRFAGWPEPTTLFYSTFDDDVQGVERPLLVQGAAREGYVTGAPGAKGRRTIELGLPSSIPSLPADAMLRLRVRTTAARIQCGVGWNSSRAVPLTVAQRNRTDTGWTTLSIAFSALDPDGHRAGGGGGGGRRGFRGNLTLVAEAPSRVSSEDLVFDIDEIEITRP